MKNFHKYLAITSLEEAWGFYLTTVGYTNYGSNEPYPHNQGHPKTHSFTWNRGRILNGYYLVYISKGQGVFESAQSKPTVITAGSCFFLFPGVWHRYRPDKESGWKEYWIGFKGYYPDALMRQGFFKTGSPVIQLGLNENLLSLMSGILDKVRTAEAGYHQIVSGMALQTLGQVLALSTHHGLGNDANEQLIAKAKFYLKEHLDGPLDMLELVRELSVSYSKFRKLFKETTGQSPHQYHLNLRLDRAKELLGNSDLTISEVAYRSGFDSVFYFSRLFKKKNLVAPSNYRSSLPYLRRS